MLSALNTLVSHICGWKTTLIYSVSVSLLNGPLFEFLLLLIIVTVNTATGQFTVKPSEGHDHPSWKQTCCKMTVPFKVQRSSKVIQEIQIMAIVLYPCMRSRAVCSTVFLNKQIMMLIGINGGRWPAHLTVFLKQFLGSVLKRIYSRTATIKCSNAFTELLIIVWL